MKALPVITFAAGGAAGALIMWLARPDESTAASPVAAASLATENKILTDKMKALEKQVASVPAGKAAKKDANATPEPVAGQGKPELITHHLDESKIEEMMKQQAERDVNREVDKMALRLKLTAEQKESLRKFLLAQKESERSLFRSAMKEGGKADPKQPLPDKDEFLKSLLTPEQQADYARSREEQRTARAEEYAQRRVRRLNEQLSLSEEQKDRLFQAYAQQKLAATDPNAPKPANAPQVDTITATAGGITFADAGFVEPMEIAFDPADLFPGGGGDLDRSVLEGILTPDQMGVYDRRKAEEKEQFKASGLSLLPGLDGVQASGIHIEVQKADNAPQAAPVKP